MTIGPASSDTSILGLEVGDEIKLTGADFRRLADAFFAEMEHRFKS